MNEPVVGKGASHSEIVRQGARRANEMRNRFYIAMATGEITFPALVENSRMDEFKALGKMKLLRILKEQPKWSESSAIEALKHIDIGVSDNILDIRKNSSKMESFDLLIRSGPDKWKARPRMPEGWPFFGKLSEVLSKENNIKEIPQELADLMEDDDEMDSSFLKGLE